MLVPWMDAAAALAPPPEAETELPLDALRRFLMAPAEQFLRQRLGLRLAELDAAGEDVEPLQAPGRGLERSQLQRAVFDALLADGDADAMHPALRARGLLPSGPLGRRALAEVVREVRPYAQHFAQWRGDAQPQSLPLEVEIDDVRLHGRIKDIWPQGIARLRFGERNGPSAIRHGLDWLLASAAGVELPFVEFQDDVDHGVGAHTRQALPRDTAIEALRGLLTLRAYGLRRPLPFAPYSAWKMFNGKTWEQRVKQASDSWHGFSGPQGNGWAEGDSEALRLALRGRNPFGHATTMAEFAALTFSIYGLVTAGEAQPVPEGEWKLPGNEEEEAS